MRTPTTTKLIPKITKLPVQSKPVSTPLPAAVPKLPVLTNPTLGRRMREQERYVVQQQAEAQAAKDASYKTLGGVRDPNDKYSLNSFADVFNFEGAAKRYGDWVNTWWARLFVPIQAITLLDVGLFQPIVNHFTGDFKALGINSLTSFSETMDIFAAPIKSLIAPLVNSKKAKEKEPEKYEMPWWKKFLSSSNLDVFFENMAAMGGQGALDAAREAFGENGRYNWDYDTGFWLSDFGLELISNPLTVLSIIFSGGSASAAKESAKSVGKEVTKTVASELGEEVAENLSEQAVKKVSTQIIKDAVALNKTATEIARIAKETANATGDDVLRTLAGDLDAAIMSSKGIADKATQEAVEKIGQQTAKVVESVSDEAADKAIKKGTGKLVNQLNELTEHYTKTANRTLADVLLDSKVSNKIPKNVKFTKAAKKEYNAADKLFKKAIKSGDEALAAEKKALLDHILSSPESAIKYKGIDLTDDFLANAKQINLVDYMQGCQDFINDARTFQFMNAFDSLAEGVHKVDSALMKGALLGNPVTAGFYYAFKKGPLKKVGNAFAKAAVKKLTDVGDWFYKKLHPTLGRMMEYVPYQHSMEEALKRINLFSKEIIDVDGFQQELARTVYDDVWAWLRGFGAEGSYGIDYAATAANKGTIVLQKPINLLQHQDQLVKILKNESEFAKEFAGLADEAVLDKFFKQFDNIGNIATTGTELQLWDWNGYLKNIDINVEADDQMRLFFKDINTVLAEKDPLLKMTGGDLVRTFDNRSAEVSSLAVHTELEKAFPQLFENGKYISSAKDIKSLLIHSAVRDNKAIFRYIDDLTTSLHKGVKAIERANELTEKIKAVKAIVDIEAAANAEHKATAKTMLKLNELQDALEETYKTAHDQFTLFSNNLNKAFNEELIQKGSDLEALYKGIQRSRITSPYFNTQTQLKAEAKQYLELKHSQQYMTRKILESSDFKYLIDGLREGSDAAKLISSERVRLIQEINALGKKTKENGKQLFELNKRLRQLDYIRHTVDSVDAYVEHLALLEASNLPDAIKQVYLDTLHGFEQRSAKNALNHFDAFVLSFQKRMNDQLVSTKMTHRYTLDYYRTKLLNHTDEHFREAAKRSIASAHTAQADAEFCETMFEAEILPELSRATKEIVNGKEVEMFSSEWLKMRNKTWVFFDFETSGLNSNMHEIYDIGFKVRGGKSYSLTRQLDETSGLSEAVKRQLFARGNLADAPIQSEAEMLINFANQVKAIEDELTAAGSFKGFVFAGHNTQGFDISFLDNRFLRLMERANINGDAELLDKLNQARSYLLRRMNNSGFDTLTQLRKLDGIPTVGDYTYEIRRLLRSHCIRQSNNGADLVMTLNQDFLENLKAFKGFGLNDYQQRIDDLYNLLREMRQANKNLAVGNDILNYGGKYTILNGDIYHASEDAIFDETISIEDRLAMQSVYIENPDELLQFTDGHWVYKGEILPEAIQTSTDAVKYLRQQGRPYSPAFRALNASQQFSTYPVMINGKLTMQTLEGINPIAYKKYIDYDLAYNFFDIGATDNLIMQHQLTELSQTISSTFNKIKRFDLLEKYSEKYSELYQKLLKAAEGYDGIFHLLRQDANLYQQYAIIRTFATEADSPFSDLIRSELRTWDLEAKNLVYEAKRFVDKPTEFTRIFDTSEAGVRNIYSEDYLSVNEYIEKIYSTEKSSTVYTARDLNDALDYDKTNVLNISQALKQGLDKHKSYAASMQRHGILGQAQIELDDAYIECVKDMTQPEFDAFIACDRQVVNNLEDAIVMRFTSITDPEQMRSFVYHQGKGVVVLPAKDYLENLSNFTYNVREVIPDFIRRWKGYEDEFIKVINDKGNLIFYAKNYQVNIRNTTAIPFRETAALNYNDAFWGAYGLDYDYIFRNQSIELFNEAAGIPFPVEAEAAFRQAKAAGHAIGEADNIFYYLRNPNISIDWLDWFEYLGPQQQQQVLNVLRQESKKKGSEFLFTHYDKISKVHDAFQKYYDNLERLATDWSEQYPHFFGGYGRTIDHAGMDELFARLPKEVGDNVLAGKTAADVYTQYGDIFNFSTLGRAAYRKAYEPFASSSLQEIQGQAYRQMSYSLSTVSQFAQFYYGDSPMQLSNLFGIALKEGEYADNRAFEIISAINGAEDFTVSCMGFDKKGLPKSITLHINSVDDLKFAIKHNAVFLPNQTHSAVVKTINTARYSQSKLLKVFNRISYGMKISMLMLNPGYIFRNLIDSSLKNAAMTKSVMADSYIDAIHTYNQYQDCIQMLFGLDPKSPFNPDLLRNLFDNKVLPLDEDTFMLIHHFITDGPSAGPVKQVQDLMLQRAGVKETALQHIYETLMKPTEHLEQIMRLAEYMQLSKTGALTQTDIFNKIVKTHFDYSAKSNVDRLIELVIPFYSFQAKNFTFWLEMIDHNPVLMRVLSNYLNASWNWSDIDFDNIQAYNSQLNNIMQANIKLNDQGLTLKMNPSFMDPLSILANPIDSLSGRVTPLFKPVLDLMTSQDRNYVLQNLATNAGTAVGGALASTPVPGLNIAGATLAQGSQLTNRYRSGITSYQRTGSVAPLILPSIFGSVKTPTQYGRASYINSRAFRDEAKRNPRRVSIYQRLYTDTGKNRWKLRMMPVDAHTLQYRIRDNQNRFR